MVWVGWVSFVLFTGFFIVFWRWILLWPSRQRQAGPSILTLETRQLERRWGGTSVVLYLMAAYANVLSLALGWSEPTAVLPAALVLNFLTMAAWGAARRLVPTAVTERGILDFPQLLEWDRVRIYHWEKDDILELLLRQPLHGMRVYRIRLSAADRQAIEPILARHVGHSGGAQESGTTRTAG